VVGVARVTCWAIPSSISGRQARRKQRTGISVSVSTQKHHLQLKLLTRHRPKPPQLRTTLNPRRVGRFIEFYGPQRVLAERVLGLRRAYLPRAGYGFLAGFPAWLGGRFGERALHCGVPFVTLTQSQPKLTAIVCPESPW
jgi:hypothetical protein